MRLIALFNLKPGVSVDIYEAWAKTVDLPVVNTLASVESFKIYRATSVLGSDAPPPYGYVEILDIPDMDAFGQDIATSTMQSVASAFQEIVDVTFLTTDEIVA